MFTICSYFLRLNDSLSAVNTNLSEKVSGFSDDNYEAVTGLAYNPTNNKLGLKVGADTVIPFSASLNQDFLDKLKPLPIDSYKSSSSPSGYVYTTVRIDAENVIGISELPYLDSGLCFYVYQPEIVGYYDRFVLLKNVKYGTQIWYSHGSYSFYYY